MPDTVPFFMSTELNTQLAIEPNATQPSAFNLRRTDNSQSFSLPGQPRIDFRTAEVREYLLSEFLTPDLNRLSPRLWLVATQNSSHISTLHHQIVRGRQIAITENPELHLVWIDDRIFIKPLPPYLLSYAFWSFFFSAETSPFSEAHRDELRRALLGYMRSYHHLVRHESDFNIAIAHRLLPKGVDWDGFAAFISGFATVQDSQVSGRYGFGDLRLTRLNFWTKFFLGRFAFQKVHGQYNAYFSRFL